MAKNRYNGLTASQVEKSRRLHGNNVFTPPAHEPLWRKFLVKFTDPLIVILLIACGLSVLISLYEFFAAGHDASVFFEPLGILVAVLLATGLAFIFEVKADREFAVLNQVNDDEPVQVMRGGTAMLIPRRDVVVGDVLMLNAGQEVPADATLNEAVAMRVDESSLTGEPETRKSTTQLDNSATYPSNCVLRGSTILEGHGIATVTAVGDSTENGRAYHAAQIDNSVRTPLNEQLDGLGKWISRISYILAALVVVGRIIIYFAKVADPNIDFEWVTFTTYMLQTVMLAVTLIVVAVPEGLPMAVTLSLAYSMRRMMRTGNLVRRMHACETMGATTVICTDKTGTLTMNQMHVIDAKFAREGDEDLKDEEKEEDYKRTQAIAEMIALNSTAELNFSDPTHPVALGNPTEGALLLWLHDRGVDYRDLRAATAIEQEIPFTVVRKYMAVVVNSPALGKRMLYVKGAPEVLLKLCHDRVIAGEEVNTYRTQLAQYQSQGMRTLGFACMPVNEGDKLWEGDKIVAEGLQFAGYVAISDPVRPEVAPAITACQHAGINVKIVTGDTPVTACEIGRQIGLWDENDDTSRAIITGPELNAMSDEELRNRVADFKIIARARPMDKQRLVEALQQRGEVVAVTGDGTNDAPALRTAHVGLSMGAGTAVAKEASDITILDNSFASIERAVMWGRSLYRNIQRFLLFQMTVNIAACLIVLIGAFTEVQSPLSVTQMLWVNLIMDSFAAMALASLPPTQDVMRDRPRNRRAPIIDRRMLIHLVSTGLLFTVVLMVLLFFMEQRQVGFRWGSDWLVKGTGSGLDAYELTIFFTTFVMLQFWNLFNARAFRSGHSAFHLRNCHYFLLIAVLIIVGQVFIVNVGGRMFNVTPLSLTDWIAITLGTMPVLLLGEATRIYRYLTRK